MFTQRDGISLGREQTTLASARKAAGSKPSRKQCSFSNSAAPHHGSNDYTRVIHMSNEAL